MCDLFINTLPLTRLAITIQTGSPRPTWVITASTEDPSGYSFPVELHVPGIHVISLAVSEMSVQIPFPISVDTLILLIPYIGRVLHTLDARTT